MLDRFSKATTHRRFLRPRLSADSVVPKEQPKAVLSSNGMGSHVNYTYPFQYATGSINALRRETTTRMISINSATGIEVYPVSTSFCVFIREFERRGEYKMSSVKIPNTYIRLRGNCFLYIIGDIPG
jgi:hypothetical protein